jgi:peroxiredoxin
MNYLKFHSKSLRSFLLISAILFTACGGRSTTVNIVGTIEGANKQLVLIREASDNYLKTIDSTRTDSKGHFEFTIGLSSPKFLLLQVKGEDEPIILLAEPGENLNISGKADKLSRNYKVSGSRGSALVRDLNFRLNGVVAIIDSLSYHFRSSREHVRFDSIKTAIDSAYFATLAQHKEYTVDFIKANRYSLASILALYQQYDKTRPVLNSRDDFELFKLVDASLYPLYPENSLVDNLHSNVNKISKQLELFDKRQDMLIEGQSVENIDLPLLNGDTIKLLEVRARYILLDFWASWCNECIPNNKKLLEVYEKFNRKGFQVVQISLDDKRFDLENLITRDSIPWIVSSDFRHWESPILESLSINSIPSNYLINQYGIIQARNLSHQELDEVLTKLLP